MILALTIPFSILFIKIYNENQAKKARTERLYWCRQRLHGLTLRFRDECMDETQKLIVRYTSIVGSRTYLIRGWSNYFVSDYKKSIDDLKKEYIINYAKKYSEKEGYYPEVDDHLRVEAESLPSYIVDEYETEISQIARTFLEISYFMADQINELKEN